MSPLIRFVLAVVLPPLGVFLTYGLSTTLVINILLTLLGWVPGIIHGVWAIAKHEEKAREHAREQQVREQQGTV